MASAALPALSCEGNRPKQVGPLPESRASRQPSWLPERIEHAAHGRLQRGGGRLQIVPALAERCGGGFRSAEIRVCERGANGLAVVWACAQALENLGRGQLHARIDENGRKRSHIRSRRDALAEPAHPGGAVVEANRHIGANRGGLADEIRRFGGISVSAEQNPDGCRGI